MSSLVVAYSRSKWDVFGEVFLSKFRIFAFWTEFRALYKVVSSGGSCRKRRQKKRSRRREENAKEGSVREGHRERSCARSLSLSLPFSTRLTAFEIYNQKVWVIYRRERLNRGGSSVVSVSRSVGIVDRHSRWAFVRPSVGESFKLFRSFSESLFGFVCLIVNCWDSIGDKSQSWVWLLLYVQAVSESASKSWKHKWTGRIRKNNDVHEMSSADAGDGSTSSADARKNAYWFSLTLWN